MTATRDRILARVRAEGPLPFSAYMALALDDPKLGFYASPDRVGARGDFATSPSATPEFGALMARALDDAWKALGSPDPFRVVEGGASTGVLARNLLDAAPAPLRDALVYDAVERSEAARQRGARRVPEARWQAHLGDVAADATPAPHVVLANELLDNLPADRFVVRGGEPYALLVGERDGALVDVPGPPLEGDARAEFRDVARALGGPAPFVEGHVGELRRAADEWVRRAASLVPRGYVVLLDYGASTAELAGDPRGSLRTYRAQRAGRDPYEAPGDMDLTVPVDWDRVERALAAAGFRRLLRGTQRDLLMRLGAVERLADLARRGTADALRRWSGLREVLLGTPGEDITVLLAARDAPPPAFLHP